MERNLLAQTLPDHVNGPPFDLRTLKSIWGHYGLSFLYDGFVCESLSILFIISLLGSLRKNNERAICWPGSMVPI